MSAARHPPLTLEAVREAIVALYLTTGRDATVSEIAAAVGRPQRAVRDVIHANQQSVPGCDGAWVDRPSVLTEAPGFASGRTHKVWAYGPSRETLRWLVVEAAKAASVDVAGATVVPS